LPFHVGIGIYLCWLRERSASLWPCMLMHGVYNAAIGLAS
jgi:membrane protease YdiL (CAAX protease family)